jgi:hypothetical protein
MGDSLKLAEEATPGTGMGGVAGMLAVAACISGCGGAAGVESEGAGLRLENMVTLRAVAGRLAGRL